MAKYKKKYDFKVNGIYYKIIGDGCVAVTRKANDNENPSYSGDVVIPSKVSYEGTHYQVTKIDNMAFSGRRDLISVAIPDSVTEIDDSVFASCTGLKNIQVDANNPVYCDIEGVLFSKDKKQLIAYPNTKADEYNIPDFVTEIGYGAFGSCTSLKSVTIPNSITEIGKYAFLGCTGLTSIEIPDNVAAIREGTFEDCTGLTSVVIPNSVKEIGEYAFWGCQELPSLTIPKSVTKIGECAFKGCTRLTTIEIPDSVNEIGERVFAGCKDLTSVTIPDSITKILKHTFDSCTSLVSVAIPNSVTAIERNPFLSCTSLKHIQVDSNNDAYCTVDGVLFSKDKKQLIAYPNTKSNEYTVPDGVVKIGDEAFNGCTGLKSVEIPDSVTEIGNDAFVGCHELLSLTIPKSVMEIGDDAFVGCTSLKSIQVDANNCAYCDIEGVLFSKDKKLLVVYPNAKSNEYKIPDSVTKIGMSAFSCCDSLTSVEISNHVTEIDMFAFLDCTELKSITIPNSVTEISVWVFYGCENLKEIICKAVTPPSIQWNIFTKEGILYVPKESVEAYRGHKIWRRFNKILPIED